MFPTGAKEEWEKCAIELSMAKLTVWKLKHLNLSSPHSLLVLHPPTPADSVCLSGMELTLSLILSVRLSVCISLSIYLSVSLICRFTVSTVSVRLLLPSCLSFFLSHSSSVSISGACKLCFYSHRLWITLLLFLSLPSSHVLSIIKCVKPFIPRGPARFQYSRQVEAWMAKQWLTVVCYSSLVCLFSSPLSFWSGCVKMPPLYWYYIIFSHWSRWPSIKTIRVEAPVLINDCNYNMQNLNFPLVKWFLKVCWYPDSRRLQGEGHILWH